MTAAYDIAIVGSGFAGSLLAMIARRVGRSVVLIEKHKHPRFAIGESSTPLSNLLLEELADRYDLPRLKPLTKWGTWQQTYPGIACGLKRGFSFYHHNFAELDPAFTRENQLLVAASPHDGIADTHWYRADVDRFFMLEAQDAGVDYVDEVQLRDFHQEAGCVRLDGTRRGKSLSFQAKFVVDATGPRGFLHHALGLRERLFPDFPQTQALYSHFSGVARFGSRGSSERPPYPIDDAALHHVFDGGWIWVLRFNNGVTSAGVAATKALADRFHFADGASAWDRLLNLLPAVQEQFAGAKPERVFTYAGQLSFLSETIVGPRWAMLPSAAAFVDPLLSTGFPLTLLGVARLAEILAADWGTPRFDASLESYAAKSRKEVNSAARLIAALHANMNNFPVFTALSLLYFAAASFSETARRLNKHHLASSFLLCDDPIFGPACDRLCGESLSVEPGLESADLAAKIVHAIQPFNVAGLGDERRQNWYPLQADDLFGSAGKLGASHAEIKNILDLCGFNENVCVLDRFDLLSAPNQLAQKAVE